MVNGIHMHRYNFGLWHSRCRSAYIFCTHNNGIIVADGLSITRIHNQNIGLTILQRFINPGRPDRIAHQVSSFFTGSSEDHAHTFSEQYAISGIGIHLFRAMRAFYSGQAHPLELDIPIQHLNIAETFLANFSSVLIILHKYRNIFVDELLSYFIPMVKMGMRDN